MNFIKYITLLIISPKEGWKDIGKFSVPNNLLLAKLFYPCLAVLALSAFVPFIFGAAGATMQNAVMDAMLDFVKYFIAFFVLSYILSGVFSDIFKQKAEQNKLNNFIAFCLTILAIFNILRNFMPGFPFFEIFPLYIIYVALKGVIYVDVPEHRVKAFVSAASALLLLVPGALKFVLSFLIPNF